jgi:hypothetical protein
MSRLWLVVSVLALVGCPPPKARTDGAPEGTPTDPVDVCTQTGDVCHYDGSQLGVCNESATDCPGPGPCYRCVAQH